MSTNKSAKLSKKLGVYLEDAVAVFELLKMPTNKSAKLFDKLGVHLEDAVGVFELLKTELDTTSSSSKATNTDMFEELNAQNADLKVIELQLQADLAEFKAKQLEAATAGVGMSMSLEEEIIKLRIQVDQLRSEISTNEAELKKSKVENKRLATDNSKLKNEKLRAEDELKDSVAELEQVKNEIKSLQADKNKILEEDPRREKSGNPKVFFDMTILGVSTGRIVFELFPDTIHGYAELFRTLCTGEKCVSRTRKPLHYKGTDIRLFSSGYITGGNLGNMTSDEAWSIYGDLKPVGKEFIKESLTLGDLFMFSEPDRSKNYSFGIFTSRNQNPTDCAVPYVVIGKVIQGIEVLHDIKIAFSNRPNIFLAITEVVIANSGQLS